MGKVERKRKYSAPYTMLRLGSPNFTCQSVRYWIPRVHESSNVWLCLALSDVELRPISSTAKAASVSVV
jgi:hypothetical protein